MSIEDHRFSDGNVGYVCVLKALDNRHKAIHISVDNDHIDLSRADIIALAKEMKVTAEELR